MVPISKSVTVENLSIFLKSKNLDIDLNNLVKQSVEKYPKAHLLENEEDDDQCADELGEEATPFERAIVEARKLKLNVDELQHSSTTKPIVAPSGTPSGKPVGRLNKRKRGAQRSHRLSTRNSSNAKKDSESERTIWKNGDIKEREIFAKKKHQPQKCLPNKVPIITEISIKQSSHIDDSSKELRNKHTGGKYKPGTAPSHWSIISNKKDFSQNFNNKALPLNSNSLLKPFNDKFEKDNFFSTVQYSKKHYPRKAETLSYLDCKSIENEPNHHQHNREGNADDLHCKTMKESHFKKTGSETSAQTYDLPKMTNTVMKKGKTHSSLPDYLISGKTISNGQHKGRLSKFLPLSRFFD